MSGIVQQLPTLIGVVIGALASIFAGAVTERARWRRERSAQWDDRRAQAYADYGYAVKNVYVQCMRADGLRRQGTGTGGNATAYEEALAELQRLTDERTAKWEAVLLLGHPQAIDAARIWHRRVWQVERFARGRRTDAENWDSLLDDVIKDRALFYTEARRDLGITSGDVPLGGPWQAVEGAAP
jgi:hypothetical protein